MKKRYFAGAAVAAMILTAGMATTSFADWSQQNGNGITTMTTTDASFGMTGYAPRMHGIIWITME